MKILVVKDYEEMSKVAAEEFEKIIKGKPSAVLGLATGSTPVGMYKKLIEKNKNGLDFSELTTFNLDEYIGLEEDNVQSYHYFMNDNFFNYVNINKDNIHIPKGNGEDPYKDAMEYEKMLENSGSIDIQVLGIGNNGHIAFNEPDENLNLSTSIINLTQSTIEANSRFFSSMEEVPKKAISMGMNSIFKAKKIILLASGENKHKAIKFISQSKYISTEVPASILHLHSDVTLIVDEKAYNGK